MFDIMSGITYWHVIALYCVAFDRLGVFVSYGAKLSRGDAAHFFWNVMT
jgi:hypothetical protein